jgi:Nucleotide modification associated domain 3
MAGHATELLRRPTMRVIFSRKGFDSTAGKAPSPIIEGEPISLPIPTKRRSETSYRLAGLGEIVEHMTNGRISADDLCHEDPVFLNGRWAFGQTGAAQTHLKTNGVDVGDVFLFFGLFASRDGQDRHHRIFGYMEVDEVRPLGSHPSKSDNPTGFLRRHPHTIGEWNQNNTLYLGSGAKARSAHPCLHLTKSGAPDSVWSVPAWLKAAGLTYDSNPARWASDKELHVASPGQEFVSNIGDQAAPREWLRTVRAAIEQ